MGSPANLTLVATLPNGLPIGYAQFLRLGPGAPAATWESTLRGAYITATKWVEDNLWRFVDRSADVDALREFMHNKEGFWGDAPEEMWYVQSLVVGESWQRKGVGRVLMAEVLDRAKVEGVMVGLEASKEGEGLYRKLGFRLRRRFAEGDVCGGVMEWVPEGNRGGEDGEGQ